MAEDSIFYSGNTVVWKNNCNWANALLDVCAVAVNNLPYELESGNIEIRQQDYGKRSTSVLSAELKTGKSSYWLMQKEFNSHDIVYEALHGLNSLEWESTYAGDRWTYGIFAEQINARLGNSDGTINLPPSGVYHYGDFVAMAMNGRTQRFMASVSFAGYAPQHVRECDLVLHAIATALSQIFSGDDEVLVDSHDVVRRDLVNHAKLMRWPRNSLNKMAKRITDELKDFAESH